MDSLLSKFIRRETLHYIAILPSTKYDYNFNPLTARVNTYFIAKRAGNWRARRSDLKHQRPSFRINPRRTDSPRCIDNSLITSGNLYCRPISFLLNITETSEFHAKLMRNFSLIIINRTPCQVGTSMRPLVERVNIGEQAVATAWLLGYSGTRTIWQSESRKTENRLLDEERLS